MANCEKIVIVGFAGAGKTTLLNELKNTSPFSNFSFRDLDELLFQKLTVSERSLSGVINRIGWESFRKEEKETLQDWLSDSSPGVLALGGGALTKETWDHPQFSETYWIFLDVPYEVCLERLKNDNQNVRPLLLEGEDVLKAKFSERKPLFNKITKKLDGTLSPKELAAKVWSLVVAQG